MFLPLLGDFRTLVGVAQDSGLDEARAAAKQDAGLSGFAIGASHPLPPNQQPRPADRRLWINRLCRFWGARLQKIVLRKRPRDVAFVHCTTNHTGPQSG